jgi:TOBE domain
VANLLDADGDAGHNGRRTVRLGGFILEAGGDGPAGLVIRPERVRVVAGAADGPNCLPAMIEQVVGPTTRVHVRLRGGDALQSLSTSDGVIRIGRQARRSV